MRSPLPCSKAKASRTASTSSVPATTASARAPKTASSTAPLESSRRRQIANANRPTAKTSPAARRAVSSGGKIEAMVIGSSGAAPELRAQEPPSWKDSRT